MANNLSTTRFYWRDPDTDEPLEGGKVYFYFPNTTTPKNTYTDAAQSNALPNPVILEADGGYDIYAVGLYKIRVTRADDTFVHEMDFVGAQGAAGGAGGLNSIERVYLTDHNIDLTEAGYTLISNRTVLNTFSLDPASDLGINFMILVKNIGTAALVIDPTLDERINGYTTLWIGPGDSTIISGNGTEFRSYMHSPYETRTVHLPSRTELSQLRPIQPPLTIVFDGYASFDDGGGAKYRRVAAQPSHQGKINLVLADGVTNQWYELDEPNPNLAMFGAFGTGTETTAISNAMTYAAAKDVAMEFIAPTYTIAANVDFLGADIFSRFDTTLASTNPKNIGRISNIKINGYSMTDVASSSPPPLECSGLIVVQYRTNAADGDDMWYVMSRNSKRNDYVAVRMGAGVGTDTGPWELVRNQSVFSLWEAFAYQSVLVAQARASYPAGTWADFDYSPAIIGAPTGVTNGSEPNPLDGAKANFIIGRRASDLNAQASLSCPRRADNTVSVMFLASTVGSNNVSVVCAGVTRTLNLRTSSGQRLVRLVMNADSYASSTVGMTITNNTSGQFVQIMGINVDRPQDVDPTLAGYDSWSYYVYSAEEHYNISTGAVEYAMRDLDIPSLVGAVHGREVRQITPIWSLDGVSNTFTKNIPKVARKAITIRQHTLIASKITSRVEHVFGDGWVEYFVTQSGTMRTDTVYLGMCIPQLVNNAAGLGCFNEVIYPRYVSVAAVGDYALGHSEIVVWRNSNNLRRVYAYQRTQPNNPNLRGGSSIESAIGAGPGFVSYAKLYTGFNVDAEKSYTGGSSHFVHVYG